MLEDGLAAEPERWSDEFSSALGHHLGIHYLAGRVHELEWVLAEIETQLPAAEAGHERELRVGLLESFANTLLDAGQELSSVASLLPGPSTRTAWQLVLDWIAPQSPSQRGEV